MLDTDDRQRDLREHLRYETSSPEIGAKMIAANVLQQDYQFTLMIHQQEGVVEDIGYFSRIDIGLRGEIDNNKECSPYNRKMWISIWF